MKSKWRKAKLALGLNLCYYVPKTLEEEEDSPPPSERFSGAALLTHAAASGGDGWSSVGLQRPLSTPGPGSSPKLKLTRSSSKSLSQKKICSICLATMKPGEGHAIFTAECSHSFHFHCITSSVKYGNQVCPVCRAKWKEIPVLGPAANQNMPQDDAMLALFRRFPSPRRHTSPPIHSTEPALFNDDESLGGRPEFCGRSSSSAPNISSPPSSDNEAHLNAIEIKTYPEVSSVESSKSHDNFTVLIHLKAPVLQTPICRGDHDDAQQHYVSRSIRTPVDLVTVLDISGSMAGTKLALLKRAMGFVIQNLSSNDRLSVIAFSSTARRLFPLSRMSEVGKQQALQAVNSLVANGGTNIAEGLRKGAKVMEERREKNPVASIILLSDGQDTYTVNEHSVRGEVVRPNYQLLLPMSIQGKDQQHPAGFQIPIHTFGFGTDHDSSLMHSVSEISGGTFSFIETEAAIQDAFAQCIGGLLSVVVQKLHVELECIHPSTRLKSIKTGSYPSSVMGRSGSIEVGDLYADEERDFLVCVNIPPVSDSVNKTSLLRVKCMFMDPFTKEMVTLEGQELEIDRSTTGSVNTALSSEVVYSLEVDRQQNRLRAAEAMSQARSAAELGELESAILILEDCRKILGSTESAKRGDKLCVALNAELKEMQERMVSRRVYEASGRAYILSGLSSHSWQRATARGDSTDNSSIIQAYQTPSMVEMLSRSQASLLGSPIAQRLVRPSWSFGSPKPR